MTSSIGDRRVFASALPGASDTIVGLATVGARSALAVLRLSGPDAQRIGAAVLTPWHPTPRQAYLATIRDPETGKAIDRGVITVYAAPVSYTGEDMIELSLHGGEIGPALATNVLLAAGARHALPGELTRRALLNGKLDLLQAEAIVDLIDSRSRAMHEVALNQLAGHLSNRLGALRNDIIELEALLVYEVDFPEEDDGPVESSHIESAARAVLASIDSLLATASTGEMIRSGASIVIAGAPNTGKSSLFNALAGTRRAIVTEVPGTTRDALEVLLDVGPWPVRLVDTAGLRVSEDVVERLGIEVAEQHVQNAAMVLVCGDSPRSLELSLQNVGRLTKATLLVVGTKSDAGGVSTPLAESILRDPRDANIKLDYVLVSAQTGQGLGDLVQQMLKTLNRDRRPESASNPILTRERHRVALTRARDEIATFLQLRIEQIEFPATVAAVHLYSARSYLETLVGALDVEEVLDRVFSTFCVGK